MLCQISDLQNSELMHECYVNLLILHMCNLEKFYKKKIWKIQKFYKKKIWGK